MNFNQRHLKDLMKSDDFWYDSSNNVHNYRLTQSASELLGFTRSSSLTMNTRGFAECGIENFELIVSDRVQVNPDNLRAMSALTSLLFKLNALHKAGKTIFPKQLLSWCF